MKRLLYLFLVILCVSSGLLAQEVVLSDEFDSGDGKWTSGWIDNTNATVAVSIDNTGKLSGTNSYKLAITKGSADMYRIQRDADCPLFAGYQYTVSFMAVATKDNAGINVLFEIKGDPYTKRLNDTATVTTTPQTFTYKMVATEDVADNQLKLHFGGPRNDSTTIWVDNIVVSRVVDPSLVFNWGNTVRGKGWPILNRADTPAGNASMGGAAAPSTWSTIMGNFNTINLTTGETVVASGHLEYVGGGCSNSYVPLRYAITFQDSATLKNQYTDTASWVSPKNHYGYQFTPRSMNADMPNGTNGVGSVWTLNNVVGWNSTYNANIRPITKVEQMPPLAEISAGIYDWAISVTSLPTGKNEVRWYLVKQHAATEQATYWFAGTVIDTLNVTEQFNMVGFGVGNGIASVTNFNLTSVKVAKGDPITVPEAPFNPFYVQNWGSTARGSAWPILNDSNYVVGDAAMGGTPAPSTWSTIMGGFDFPVTATTDKAIIIKGQLEYVGGGCSNSYVPLRYALAFQDSATLKNKNSDSAKWVSTKGYLGYQFTPRSMNADMPNGTNGVGSVWTLNNVAGWNSTYNANIRPITKVEQMPPLAEISEGVYDFGISVQPQADGSNEVRWYMVKKHAANEQATYWFAGTVKDTSHMATKFNMIGFGVGNGIANVNQFKLIAVKVDRGTPITVPEAPFNPFYVQNWGSTARGSGWPILNDSNYVVGDAAMGGTPAPSTWSTIMGGFDYPVEASKDKAIIVKGQFEYVGGGCSNSYVPLRYALAFQDSATLKNKNTDSAKWVSTKTYLGYQFTPRSMNADMPNGTNGIGSVWTLKNVAGWNSTYNADIRPIITVEQAPALAEITEGVYDFAISVQPQTDGSNEVRWYMTKKHAATEETSYWFAGTVKDTSHMATKFNMIGFGVGNGIANVNQFKLIAVKVDKGTPLTVPEAPWKDYYVSQWGFNGGTGGWDLTPGDVVGDVSISGSAAATDLVALRGGLASFTINSDSTKSLVIEGKAEFVGGGFEAANSFSFGVFQSDSAKSVKDSAWTGTDRASSGYLFVPGSGSNVLPKWGTSAASGSVGGVVSGKWSDFTNAANYSLSTVSQQPSSAVGKVGKYTFKMSVYTTTSNKNDVRFVIYNADKSYFFGGKVVDGHHSITKFNGIGFALRPNTGTTALKVTDVQVTRGNPLPFKDVTDVTEENSGLPKQYELSQNYPNPFNPTTTIKFALPNSGNVSLIVYDILGRNVATLVNSDLKAGYHTVSFNASNLSTGVYFYRIEAGNFVSVKKLMLLK